MYEPVAVYVQLYVLGSIFLLLAVVVLHNCLTALHSRWLACAEHPEKAKEMSISSAVASIGRFLQSSILGSVNVGDELAAEQTSDEIFCEEEEAILATAMEHQSEFTTFKDVNVLIGTFNVNGQEPPDDLKSWLIGQKGEVKPDLVGIGFQELDLSREAYVYHFVTSSTSTSEKQDEWQEAIDKTLSTHYGIDYVLLLTVRMVGIATFVFGRRDWVRAEKKAMVLGYSVVPTGILGYMGNKGAVAVHVRIGDSTLCFVNSHLAAHFAEFSRRNADFRTIQSYINFLDFTEVTEPISSLKSQLSRYDFPDLRDHDMVFWFGDLNYRLQTGPNEQPLPYGVVEMIHQEDALPDLGEFDQLSLAMKGGEAFSDYEEIGDFTLFKPTYKMKIGSTTSEYDIGEGGGNRVPSWTDRILFRGDKRLLSNVTYSSAPEVSVSDHKPVFARFTLRVKYEDDLQKDAILHSVRSRKGAGSSVDAELDLEIDKTVLDFGMVGFGDVIGRSCVLKNKTTRPLRYHFEPRSDKGIVVRFPPWLEAYPSAGVVPPKGKLTVDVTCKMDSGNAAYSCHEVPGGKNTPKLTKIKTVVALVAKESNEHLLALSFLYESTCFGRKLESQLTVGEARSKLPKEVVKDVPDHIPTALVRMVHHVRNYGLSKSDLYRNNALSSEFVKLRDLLCTDCCGGKPSEIPPKLPFSIHTVAIAIPMYLDSLPEPIIPYNLHDAFVTAIEDSGKTSGSVLLLLQEDLPTRNFEILRFLANFWRDLLKEGSKNGLTKDLIGVVFGPPLMRREPPARDSVPIRRYSITVNRSLSTDSNHSRDKEAVVAARFVECLIERLL